MPPPRSTGQLGDSVGGWANVLTFLVVVVSFIWARGEVKRFKEQHAYEVRSDAAREVWRGVYALGSALSHAIAGLEKYGIRALTNKTVLESGHAQMRDLLERVDAGADRFSDATADALLLFSYGDAAALHKVWHARNQFVEFVAANREGTDAELQVRSAANAAALQAMKGELANALEGSQALLSPHANLTAA